MIPFVEAQSVQLLHLVLEWEQLVIFFFFSFFLKKNSFTQTQNHTRCWNGTTQYAFNPWNGWSLWYWLCCQLIQSQLFIFIYFLLFIFLLTLLFPIDFLPWILWHWQKFKSWLTWILEKNKFRKWKFSFGIQKFFFFFFFFFFF